MMRRYDYVKTRIELHCAAPNCIGLHQTLCTLYVHCPVLQGNKATIIIDPRDMTAL